MNEQEALNLFRSPERALAKRFGAYTVAIKHMSPAKKREIKYLPARLQFDICEEFLAKRCDRNHF